MHIQHNAELKAYNTFGLSARAGGLLKILHTGDVHEVVSSGLHPLRILGGGSNILLKGDVEGYVLKNEIKGISIIDENDNNVLVEVGAGEVWHQFVLWAISKNLGGLENLALIPGTVGAAPIQNIGAYGVEQESVFHSLKAIDLTDGNEMIFDKDQCRFGYRDSIFKHELKNRCFIVSVSYLLYKKNYTVNTSYGAISEVLKSKDVHNPGIDHVADAVIEIRRSKLPDPELIGNAGSFFKNPVISVAQYKLLKELHPDIPCYSAGEGLVKVPAGWLIERAGYKGIQKGNVGVHKNQALVLVNYGQGTGQEVWQLALEVMSEVQNRFGIHIEPEVNVW